MNLRLFKGIQPNQPSLLFHGSVNQIVTENSVNTIANEAETHQLPARPSRPRILLGSPYVYSFVHETIHLSKKELKQVDWQILGWNRISWYQKTVTTLKLDKEKAVTVHSYLTENGQHLINTFKKEKTAFVWQPAVLEIIKAMIKCHLGDELSAHTVLRVCLSQEVIQIQKKVKTIAIEHTYYPNNQQTAPSEKIKSIQTLLDNPEFRGTTTSINLQATASADTPVFSALLSWLRQGPNIKGLAIKRVRRTSRIRLPFRKYLKRNTILATITAGLVLWSILMIYQENDLRNRHRLLKQSISKLQNQSDYLVELSGAEREYFKFASLFQSADHLRLPILATITRIESVLSDTTWIYRAKFSGQQIELDLLDGQKSEMTSLIEKFTRTIGKTSLEKKDQIRLDDEHLHIYSLRLINTLVTRHHE